jgi:hypothetical protein
MRGAFPEGLFCLHGSPRILSLDRDGGTPVASLGGAGDLPGLDNMRRAGKLIKGRAVNRLFTLQRCLYGSASGRRQMVASFGVRNALTRENCRCMLAAGVTGG